MRRVWFALVVVACVVVSSSLEAVAVPAGPANWSPAPSVGMARFEGAWVDLSKEWGAARACLVYPGRTIQCFRTEIEMQVREDALEAPNISCATPLKLRDGTYQSGTTVSIYPRGTWVNLSALGFDNRTSSYTVGACAVELAALSGGAGARYPRCLSAGCVENVMFSGWNNVVSSVYLH
jgi:hypothetical protein